MNKGLEALKELKKVDYMVGSSYLTDDKRLGIIETELKEKEEIETILEHERKLNNHLFEILRIIKEKRVNVYWLLTHNRKEYNCGTLAPALTQQEFDLLKEVLK